MTDDTNPTDGTISDLKDHVATMDDPAELDQLHQDEADGKDRAGAHAAIDARAAELDSGDTNQTPTDGSNASSQSGAAETVTGTGNVTGVAGETVVKTDDGQTHTTLAQTPDPASLSDADINSISGDGLKDGASQPQADAAGTLAKLRDDANSDDSDDEEIEEVTIITEHRLGPGGMIS